MIVTFLTFFDLHCTRMSLHVCPGDFFFILDSRLANCFEKKNSFWLSACIVLIVVPLLCVHPSFPLVDGRCYIIVSIPDHCLPYYLLISCF